jgi:hypothetical protein
VKVHRKCPYHRKDDFHRERNRLQRLGYDEEIIEMHVPTVPDLIQDFAATEEQIRIAEQHLDCAMAATRSAHTAITKSWSNEQRSFYERHDAHLRKFPKIFSGERIKW